MTLRRIAQVTMAATASTLALAAGSGGPRDQAALPSAWRIQAGPATVTGGGQPMVSGSFRLSGAADPTSAQRQLNGGACLVADLVPYGIGAASCTTNADCNGPQAFDASRDPRFADYVGYCIAPDGSGAAPRCWTRPGPPNSHCLRSIDGLVLQAGEFSLGPVDADPLRSGTPLPSWAVLACLAEPAYPRACGEAVSVHRQTSLSPHPDRQRDP